MAVEKQKMIISRMQVIGMFGLATSTEMGTRLHLRGFDGDGGLLVDALNGGGVTGYVLPSRGGFRSLKAPEAPETASPRGHSKEDSLEGRAEPYLERDDLSVLQVAPGES